jgi:hypothetical protein
MWVCAKVLKSPWTTSAYQWSRRIPSDGQPGAGPNGCRQGGYYATCDLICLHNYMPSAYRGYCNSGGFWSTDLANSPASGCLDYSSLTAAQNCP